MVHVANAISHADQFSVLARFVISMALSASAAHGWWQQSAMRSSSLQAQTDDPLPVQHFDFIHA